MEMQCDVVVVGLGAMGAATLYQLAKRGVNVVGVDRFEPPHDQGSSHGDTRITRQAVGEGAEYVPLVRNSHRIWRELESQTGDALFEACGVLVMTSSDVPTRHHGTADFTLRTIELANTYGIEHEVLSASDIRARFPQFGPVRDDAVGYFEPGGGYVRPERCIAAQLSEATRLGARLHTGATVTTLDALSEAESHSRFGQPAHADTDTDAADGKSQPTGVKIVFGDTTLFARQAIVTAGMWTADLLGAPFKDVLRVCRQQLFWFKLDTPVIFPEKSPSFILSHGATDSDICYGFPPIPGEGSMKIAGEQYQQQVSPATLERTVSEADVTAMFRDHVAGRIAGVLPELVKSSVCTYTVTPDFGFIIDRHPQIPAATVVSACSGHGFKHSAAIGEALAQQVVDGRSEVDLSAFSLARFKARED